MRLKSWMKASVALTAAWALSACGGGGGVDPNVESVLPTSNEVPASATASPEAFSLFAARLPADDSAEPLSVTGLIPPTSDTTEPVDLK